MLCNIFHKPSPFFKAAIISTSQKFQKIRIQLRKAKNLTKPNLISYTSVPSTTTLLLPLLTLSCTGKLLLKLFSKCILVSFLTNGDFKLNFDSFLLWPLGECTGTQTLPALETFATRGSSQELSTLSLFLFKKGEIRSHFEFFPSRDLTPGDGWFLAVTKGSDSSLGTVFIAPSP